MPPEHVRGAVQIDTACIDTVHEHARTTEGGRDTVDGGLKLVGGLDRAGDCGQQLVKSRPLTGLFWMRDESIVSPMVGDSVSVGVWSATVTVAATPATPIVTLTLSVSPTASRGVGDRRFLESRGGSRDFVQTVRERWRDVDTVRVRSDGLGFGRATFVTVTVALGTTAPFASWTVPVIVPVFDWAKPPKVRNMRAIAARDTRLSDFLNKLSVHFQPPTFSPIRLLCNRLFAGIAAMA